MDLFGVQDLGSSKASIGPGYAYVPDLGPTPSSTGLTKKRKAAEHRVTGTAAEHSSAQNAKIMRELAELDKDSYRDAQIPVPSGRASNASRTPAVKKILASQKTFANHLSDAEALAAAAPSIISSRNPSIAVAATPTPEAKRSHRRKDLNAPAGTPLRKGSAAQVVEKPDTLLPIPPLNTAEPEWAMPHRRTPADEDPLLMSKIPPMPSQEEIDALLRAPPLTYWEASATLNEGAPPPRKFCALCGYWGRVRCKGCGMRVCALECLRSHEEECYKRYGA